MFDNAYFFNLNIEKLPFQENNYDLEPSQNMLPYGRFEIAFGEIKFLKYVKKNENYDIIKLCNASGLNLVLKRYIVSTNLSGGKILQDKKLRNHIVGSFREFIITKFVSAHPCGVTPYGYQITKVKNFGYLVMEFLMEDGGTNLNFHLKRIVKDPTKTLPLNIMKNSANVLSYIEKLQINYNDIKLENFLLDSKDNLKIIDFDISQTINMFNPNTFKNTVELLGYTKGFASPEILLYFENTNNLKKSLLETIDLWKADIYSWGILCLILFGALESGELLKEDYINISHRHENICKKIDKVILIDKQLTSKIQSIIKCCLDLSPEKRPNFEILNELLNTKTNLTDEEIKHFIAQRLGNLIVPRSSLLEKIEMLERTIAELNSRILRIKENYEIQIENLQKQIQDITKLNMALQIKIHSLETTISDTCNDLKQLFPFCKESSDLKSIIKELKEQNLTTKLVHTNFQLGVSELQTSYSLSNDRIQMNVQRCKICNKYQNYEEMKNCIILNKKFNQKAIEQIKNEKEWKLFKLSLPKEEICTYLDLASMSSNLIYMGFYGNPNFDDDCLEFLCKVILSNNSLYGLDLYSLNLSSQARIQIFNMVKDKTNLKYFAFSCKGISQSDLDIIKSTPKIDYNIFKDNPIWNHYYSYMKVIYSTGFAYLSA